MMKYISKATAEQIAFVLFLIIGGIVVYFSSSAPKEGDNFSIPDTKVAKSVQPPLPPPNFTNTAVSFRGVRNPFMRQREMELANIPQLPLMTPPRENIALPSLSPYPSFEKFKKFNYFKVGGVIQEKLLSASELDELKAMKEDDESPIIDRRKEKEREKAIVYVKEKQPIEGLIVFQNDKLIQISTDKLGTLTLNKVDIQKIELNWTYEEKYKHETASLKSSDADGHYKLCKWCISMGMIPEAIEELKRAIAINKRFLDAYTALAELYRQHTNFDDLIELYKQAIEIPQFNRMDFISKLGNIYLEINIPENAVEYFKSIVDEIPGNEAGRVGLAKAYIKLGAFDEALKHADKAVEYNGNSHNALQMRALSNLLLGNMENAKRDVQKAFQLNANDSETINLLGVLDFLNGFYKSSAQKFHSAIKLNQYQIQSWMNLGVLYIMAADYTNAEIILNNAIARDPTNPYLISALALCQIGKGNKDIAVKYLQNVLQMDSNNYYVDYALGVISLSGDNLKDAQTSFEKALTQNYFYLPAHYNAAITYFKQGNFEIAAIILKNLLELDKTKINTYLSLGLAYLGLGNFEEAEKVLLKARQEWPNDAQIWSALGYLNYYWGESDHEKRLSNARTFFDTALRFASSDKYATDAMAMIDDFLSKAMFQENFQREDSGIIGRGWSEIEKYGVDIKLKQGKCVFEGGQKVENLGVTALERKMPANAFISLEAVLLPENIKDAEVGIALDFSEPSKGVRMGLRVFINMKGKLVYGVSSWADNNPQAAESKYQPQLTAPVNIAIKKVQDEATTKLAIYVNNQLVDSVPLLYTQSESWYFSVYGRGLKDRDYKFAVDNIRIYEKRPEKRSE